MTGSLYGGCWRVRVSVLGTKRFLDRHAPTGEAAVAWAIAIWRVSREVQRPVVVEVWDVLELHVVLESEPWHSDRILPVLGRVLWGDICQFGPPSDPEQEYLELAEAVATMLCQQEVPSAS